MKEKMTERQLFYKEHIDEAQRANINLEVAYNIFNNTVNSKEDMELLNKSKDEYKDPVALAIRRLVDCELEYENFYSRTKEELSFIANNNN